MVKLYRITLYFLFLAMTTAMILPIAFCQDATQEIASEEAIKVLSGEVISVDAANSSLEVKAIVEEAAPAQENVILSINDSTIIMKEDASPAVISDLNPADKIDITYVITAEGKKIAKSIIVKKI